MQCPFKHLYILTTYYAYCLIKMLHILLTFFITILQVLLQYNMVKLVLVVKIYTAFIGTRIMEYYIYITQ